MIEETHFQSSQLNKYPMGSNGNLQSVNQMSIQSVLNDLKTEFNINSPLASSQFNGGSASLHPSAAAAFSMPFSTKISQYKTFVSQLDDVRLQSAILLLFRRLNWLISICSSNKPTTNLGHSPDI